MGPQRTGNWHGSFQSKGQEKGEINNLMGGGTGNILQQEVGLGKVWQLGRREQLGLNQQEKGANTEDKTHCNMNLPRPLPMFNHPVSEIFPKIQPEPSPEAISPCPITWKERQPPNSIVLH